MKHRHLPFSFPVAFFFFCGWLSERLGELADAGERGARSRSVHGLDLAGDLFRRLGTDAVNANSVSPDPATIGTEDALSVRVAVTGSGATPTGSVTLSGGGYTSAQAALASGSFTFTIPANRLNAGTDILTASYGGDSNYLAATGSCTVSVTATAPGVPTGLAAMAGNNSISLTWTAPTGASSYKIYRGTTTGGESTTPIATDNTATAYADSTAANNTTYFYKVAAVNRGGTSELSNEASATPGTSLAPQLIGNQILDIDGNRIIGRGPEMVVASTDNVGDIDTIAGWGANGVRMLLTLDAANGMTPATFNAIVGEAVKKHMLVWISLYMWDSSHNYAIGSALGGGNFYSLTAPAGTGTCSDTTPTPCYLAVWQRQWLKDLVAKYQSSIIVDGMQEFVGATSDPSTEAARQEWEAAAKTNLVFFRTAGYTQPIEIMTNSQGRDLYAIHEYGDSIRSTDTVTVSGYPQTMFGWQAYWGTTDHYYPDYQGALFYPGQSKTLNGPDAIHSFATQENFPIEIGIDNYGGDTNLDFKAEIDQSATDNGTWPWWSYGSGDVECPVSGAACSAYVKAAPNGFGGATPLIAP